MAQRDLRRESGDRRYDAGGSGRGPGRRRGSTALRVLFWLAVIVVASCLLAVFVLQSANDAFGFDKPDNQIEITIESGMSVNQIASLLKSKGIIEKPSTFRIYSMLRNREGIYQAGDYVLNSNMGYDQIISALKLGNTIKEEVKLTFYEGMSAVEIANLLAKEKVCDRDEFLEYVQKGEFGFEFEDMLPKHELRYRQLEGYLFPDTYDFYVGENVPSVVKRFLRNFQARVFPELYDEILDAGMTLDEAITMASIIQKEAGTQEEMAHVSSVFHNRLDNPTAGLPRLQSDVTIFYVEKDIKPFQSHSTQDIYDAYNTYVCNGLPVGPICSPGLDAIRAAINPSDDDDYYFVTDIHGTYYYSKTLEEHYANVRRAEAAGGADHGTDVT